MLVELHLSDTSSSDDDEEEDDPLAKACEVADIRLAPNLRPDEKYLDEIARLKSELHKARMEVASYQKVAEKQGSYNERLKNERRALQNELEEGRVMREKLRDEARNNVEVFKEISSLRQANAKCEMEHGDIVRQLAQKKEEVNMLQARIDAGGRTATTIVHLPVEGGSLVGIPALYNVTEESSKQPCFRSQKTGCIHLHLTSQTPIDIMATNADPQGMAYGK